MRGSPLAIGVVLVLSLSACTREGAPELSKEAQVYLETVDSIENDFDAAMTGIADALDRTYNTREALFGAVGNADLPGTATDVLNRASALVPPSEFAEDHQRWIDFRSTVVESIDDLELALSNRDLQQLVAVNAVVVQGLAELLGQVSPEFCLAVVPTGHEGLCPPPDSLPGGDYGETVHEILRSHVLDTSGLFFFPLDMSPDERALRLDQVQPSIEESLKSTGDALEELSPPDEFAGGHAALVRFFDEQYQTAVAITKANAAGDNGRVQELFNQSVAVFLRLRDALSGDMTRIAQPLLEGGL